MFIYSDLINYKCTHQEYYQQMVTSDIQKHVIYQLGESIYKSTDYHLNDIKLEKWDDLTYIVPDKLLYKYGSSNSISEKVCVLKTAARMYKNGITI